MDAVGTGIRDEAIAEMAVHLRSRQQCPVFARICELDTILRGVLHYDIVNDGQPRPDDQDVSAHILGAIAVKGQMSDSNRSASVVEIKAPGTGGKQRLKVSAGGPA